LFVLALAGCAPEVADPNPSSATEPWWTPAMTDPDVRPSRLAPLPAEPLPEADGKLGSTLEECSLAYFRRPAGQRRSRWREHPRTGFQRTHTFLGIRREFPLPDERPDPLVVLVGDSHVDGVVSDDEVCTHLLEQALADADPDAAPCVLNVGCGFYTFPNYLGTAVRFAALEPELFVVVVYGGNDFGSLLPMQRALDDLPPLEREPDYMTRLRAGLAVMTGERRGAASIWQDLNQVASFAANPETIEPTLELALDYTRAIDEVCESSGTDLLVVYLPPARSVGDEVVIGLQEPVLELLELTDEELGVTDRMADRYLERLESSGIATLDLRPAFAAADQSLYWMQDEHINIAGHALLADALFEGIRERRR
jgi:hypothetical protein